MPRIATTAWATATFMTAVLTIVADPWALDAPALAWIFKPMTTVLIMAYAWGRGRDWPVVRTWVMTGLTLSLAGDVALLWPKEGFLPGLVSFLLAHLAYLIAFTRVRRFAASWWPFLFYAVVAGGVLLLLWRGVPAALRAPVVAYVLCLAAMAAQAAVLWRGARGTDDDSRAKGLAIGGALFVASDALLAINKFALPLPVAGLWILSTYWAAQWYIASWLAPARRRSAHMPLNKPV